jgi:hypothetical protein
MPDSEQAAMEPDQAMRTQTLPDAGLADSHGEQLRAADDPVLPLGNGPHAPIQRGLGAFWVHLNP